MDSNVKIVLTDDDYTSRQSLKFLLAAYLKNSGINPQLYSADEGVESLGYIFITNPDIIILDTTLPKYSGMELIYFLDTNPKFNNKLVILLEENQTAHENSLYRVFLNKRSKSFFGDLTASLDKYLQPQFNFLSTIRKNFKYKFNFSLIKNSFGWAVKGQRMKQKLLNSFLIAKPFFFFLWLFAEFFSGIYLALLSIFGQKIEDKNIKQNNLDLRRTRSKAYPAMATLFVAFSFFIFQIAIYFLGGVVFMNHFRFNSILADLDSKADVELTDSTFDNNEVEGIDAKISLKAITISKDTNNLENKDVSEQTIVQPISTQIADNFSVAQPQVVFNKAISFTGIQAILEDSSLNTFETSIPDVNAEKSYQRPETLVELKNRVFEKNSISYQLSPDKTNWYYFNGDGIWERTEASSISSNTVQEINQYLQEYINQVGGNTLYIKAFIHSDGAFDTTLNRLQVVRTQSIIATSNNPETQQSENSDTNAEIPDEINVMPAPALLNASYANGNKIVAGRVDKLNVSDEQLSNIKVEIYFTDSTDIKFPATNIGEKIGETTLEKINLNGVTQYVFELKTPSTPGGFLTAQLDYKDGSVKSELSKPLENSTFTVNMASDQDDVSAGDGSCDVDAGTAGSQCTLRAAIKEANALAGNDSVNFNIPTADAGYRDYDNANSSNSGDSTGGDDYWTIRPSTALTITSNISLDATTQTSNQGNLNTAGPEIELSGVSSSSTLMFSATNSSTVTMKGIALNHINSSGTGINVDSANFNLYNSYLGTDVKGLNPDSSSSSQGISFTNMCGFTANIGTTTSDGNVISMRGYALRIDNACPSTTNAFNFNVKGNIFGLDPTGLILTSSSMQASIGTSNGLPPLNFQLGGSNTNERNIINGQVNLYRIFNSALTNIAIYNNYFGTDINGGGVNLNQGGIYFSTSSTYRNIGSATIAIGANGKGNLIKGVSSSGGITFSNYDTVNVSIDSNSIAVGTSSAAINIAGIYDNNGTSITNNYIGQSLSDPYFGVQLDATDGILLYKANPIISGNVINEVYSWGIREQESYSTIGGTSSFTNSLCGGLKKNCITSNGYGGILSYEETPSNESTLYADNDFTGGNGDSGAINIMQGWYGYFEIFSGNARRTDLTDSSLTLSLTGNNVRVLNSYDPTTYTYRENDIKNRLGNCSTIECPASSTNSSGTSGKSDYFSGTPFITGFGSTGSYLITEYIINNSGTKTDYSVFKFELRHLVSNAFSFDADSTSDPVTTGTDRHLSPPFGPHYYDRGTYWTDNPDATRDVSMESFGLGQNMEIEYVDANPILNGGNYQITVDSTTNEDNVSLSQFDDGAGAMSGGGTNGVDGLPNGKTSIKEALYLAKAFSSHSVTIKFSTTNLSPTNTITIATPNTANAVILDGTGVTINGANMPAGSSCLEITDGYNFTIQNFTFINCKGSAIKIDGTSQGIKLTGNIFSNSSASNTPIDLSGGTENSYKVTTNDSGDTDTGANNLMNAPTITNISYIGSSQYTITGTIDEQSSEAPITITLCENSDHVSSHGGCTLSRGSTTTSTNSWSITTTIAGDNGTQSRVFSALATNTLNSTSEFSANYAIPYSTLTLNSPIDGIDDSTPQFSWNAGSNSSFDHYEITLDGNLLASVASNQTSYQYSGTPLVGNHSWNIAAITNSGLHVGDSDTENFSINTYVLVPLSPDGTISDQTPLFDWSDSSDPDLQSYNLYFDGNFIINLPAGTSEYQYSNTPMTGSHFWVVDEISGDTTVRGTTGTTNFTITPIFIPISTVYPTGDINDTTPLFDWNTNGDSDLDHYDIYLDNNLIATTNAVTTSYQYAGTELSGTHTWKVVGIKSDTAKSGESDLISFEIKPQAITVQSLSIISPKDAISTDDDTPALYWEDIDDDLIFYYQIFLNGIPIATSEKDFGPSYTLDSLEEGTYTWKVAALDENRTIIYQSDTETFSVDFIYNLTLKVKESLILDSQFISTKISWTRGGTTPPENSYYLLEFFNDENEKILVISSLSLETLEYALTEQQLKSLILGQTYTIQLTLKDPDGKTLQTSDLINLETIDLTLFASSAIESHNNSTNEDSAPFISFENLKVEDALKLAPLVLAAGISAATAVTYSSSFYGIFIGFFLKKKKKYWGIVYDSTSTKGISFAIVRLLNTSSNSLIKESVSDLDGKYMLDGSFSGNYKLSVEADGYPNFEKLISINNELGVTEDIALSSRGTLTFKELLKNIKTHMLKHLNVIYILIMIVGITFTVYATQVSPNSLNYILLALYAVVLVINIFQLYRSSGKHIIGRALEENTSNIIAGATMRIYNQTIIEEIIISDNQGNFNLKIKPGKYRAEVRKDGYIVVGSSLDNMIDIEINEKGKLVKDIYFRKSAERKYNPFG